MKKVILILFAFTALHYVLKANLRVGNTRYSHCAVSGSQTILGPFNAEHAKLGALTVTGNCDLDESTAESLSVTGPCKLKRSKISRHFSGTGSLTASHTEFGSCSNTGPLDFKHVTIDGSLKNTGPSTIVHSSGTELKITGPCECEHNSFEGGEITGTTKISDSKYTKKLILTGQTNLRSSSFGSLKITGKTTISHCSAHDAEITGNSLVDDCEIKEITLTCQDATFDSCNCNVLYVEKNDSSKSIKDPTVIKIAHSNKSKPNNYIKRIVCADPETKIIFLAGSTKADDIKGTEHITYN
ncbi:hypothetical protein FJ366_01195 [Candidatus Dependentiae bacterium]|nr:hypothetical protein [Candidatus Dependentiae bacterium]